MPNEKQEKFQTGMTMKKLFVELIISALVVFVPTFFVYSFLNGFPSFWDAQFLWSFALALCWVVVATAYYRQGWLVRKTGNSNNVSIMLPITVFFVQCILFVKGVYYNDWSLIWGAVVVNSGVTYSIYQILRSKHILKK